MDKVGSVLAGAISIGGLSVLLATISYLRYLAHETSAPSTSSALPFFARAVLVGAAAAVAAGVIARTIIRFS